MAGLSSRLLMGGGSITPPAPGTVVTLTTATNGGWSWFGDPRAIEHNGNLYVGFVHNASGDVRVASWDIAGATLTGPTTLKAALDTDDHTVPALLVRASDSRILAWYTKPHTDHMYQRISTNPEDITAFGSETDLHASLGGASYTYPAAIQVANGDIYLFYRNTAGSENHLYYSVSTDDGATWSAQTKILDTNARAYWKIERNGASRIDFAASDKHPTYEADGSIWHFYLDTSDGTWHESDGTAQTLPLDTSKMTQVYDGAAGDEAWIWDVAIGSDGYPRAVFATFPSTSDHRYQYARWTGSAWDVHEIVAAGGHIYGNGDEPNYSGGVVLDHVNPNVVYASVQDGSAWELHRYLTSDGGASFSSLAITSGSGVKNIRPVSVREHATGPSVVWLYGTYTSWLSYSLGIKGY